MCSLNDAKLLSFVIPCYNEEESIHKLYQALIDLINQIGSNYRVEVIIVNDGSIDNTYQLLKDIHSRDKRFKIINFSRNFGQQLAITAGLDYAKGHAVVIMDADLQDPPQVVLEMLKKWERGYDVVYGKKIKRDVDNFFKKVTAYWFYRILSFLADVEIPRDVGDFRLLDRKVVDVLNKFREKNRFLRGLVPYLGFKQVAVEFERAASTRRVSHYSLKKMLKLASDAIVSFSKFPIKLTLMLGVVLTFIGLVLTLFYIINGLVWKTSLEAIWLVVFLLFLLSGINVLLIGFMFSYIGRIFDEVLGRPLYIISEILD